MLDKLAEFGCLSSDELNLKHGLHEKLTCLLNEQEIKWYQWGKVKTLLEGDRNTKHIQIVANQTHRKTQKF